MDSYGELIALALDACALALCLRHLGKWRAVLRDLDEAPSLDVDAELEARLRGAPEGRIGYAAVRGRVVPRDRDAPLLRSSDEKETGVVRRFTLREHVVARSATGFWSDEARTVHEALSAVPFCLASASGGVRVEVVDALSAHLIDMDLVADRFEPLSPSLLDHVWGYLAGVRRRGIQTTEEMLKGGAYATAVGELALRGDALQVRPPDGSESPLFLVAGSKSALIRKIGESQSSVRVLTLVFGTIAIAIVGRIAYKYVKRRREAKKSEELKERLAATRRQRRELGRDKNLREDQLCVVCAENPKEIILLPCGHVSLCENCSENIRDKCPVCRIPIENRAPAFIT